MYEDIDWEALALRLGTLKEGGELVHARHAQQAMELLLGEENMRKAVDYYISGKPGSELARHVLRQVQPWSAMKYCYEIYKSQGSIQTRRLAVLLLRWVADKSALAWVSEFLEDEDSIIQGWGMGVAEELAYTCMIEMDDAEHLLRKAQVHSNVVVREQAEATRQLLLGEEPQDGADAT